MSRLEGAPLSHPKWPIFDLFIFFNNISEKALCNCLIVTSTLMTIFTETGFAPPAPLRMGPISARKGQFLAVQAIHGQVVIVGMLTEIYMEALLVDEELVDQVWEAWDKGEIDGQIAWLAWILISFSKSEQSVDIRRQ